MIAVEGLFVVFAAMGVLFTGAGLLIALVEEVLGPIWEGWMGPGSYGDDPPPSPQRWEDELYREGGY